jgi:integrase
LAVYKRADSPYWWMVLTPPTGGAQWKSTKIPHDAPTAEQRAELKKAATAIYSRRQAELVLQANNVGPKPARTLNEHLAWYETNVTAHKGGASREREILEQLRKDLGALQLTEITKARAIEWRTKRRATVVVSTAEREMSVLKHALAQAVPTYLDASPIMNLPQLRNDTAVEPGVLSRRDERKLLKALAPPDRAIVIAALDTLARAGELLDLKWSQDHKKYLQLHRTKSSKPRKVPVSARLRMALNGLPKTNEYIFAHRRHGKTARTRTNGLKGMLLRGCAAADVTYGRATGFTFHGLRHTGTTRMVAAGVDLRTVMELGGWTSLRQLARYAHPTEPAKRRAVEAVGRAS